MDIDLTVVVAVDSNYLRQFELSSRTWFAHHPWLWNQPWILILDEELTPEESMRAMRAAPSQARICDWPGTVLAGLPAPKFESQKHKMLSSFLYCAHAYVETRWWLKLDCDAVCYSHNEQWNPLKWEKFGDVAIAPGWSYTVPSNLVQRVEDWADGIDPQWSGSRLLKEHPRLNIPYNPNERTVRHKRFCSWCAAFSTNFTGQMTIDCLRHRPGMLPVDSQDTVFWYYAERLKEHWTHWPVKRLGWETISNTRRLARRVSEVVGDTL